MAHPPNFATPDFVIVSDQSLPLQKPPIFPSLYQFTDTTSD